MNYKINQQKLIESMGQKAIGDFVKEVMNYG